MEQALTPKQQQEARYMAYRARLLPQQLERAYRRVEALQREARRLGMTDIIRELQP